MPYLACIMAKKLVKLTLRIPVDTHDALVKLANSQHRSLNGQLLRFIAYGLKCEGKGWPTGDDG